MSDYETLFNSVNDPVTEGIFTYIKSNVSPVPEYLEDSETLNIGYYYYHSGNKITSPLVDRFLSDGILPTDNSNKIAKLILNSYLDNWNKLYKALIIDYSPIENVDEYLTETTDTTGNKKTTDTNMRQGTDNHSKTGSDSVVMTGTDTHAYTGTDIDKTDTDNTNFHHEYLSDVHKNPKGTTETIEGIAGFNSDEYSKSNKSTTTVDEEITDIHRTLSIKTDGNGKPVLDADGNEIDFPEKNSDQFKGAVTDTVTRNTQDTQTLDRTDTTNYNSSDNETINITDSGNGSEDTTGKENHELRRHGNVGVTTNQQMITAEIELRKHYFAEYLYADIDRFMAIPIY